MHDKPLITPPFERLTDADRALLRQRLEHQLEQLREVTDAGTRIRTRDVHTALRRLLAGSYDECVLCGGDIDRRWLLAYPSTRLCAHCQEDQLQSR
jgi:RNA polymerase-binding transcription factor DksA